MSPEYAIDGIFSTKSDVFSFGVLVLEIVSGKRNRQFHHPGHDLNLLGHVSHQLSPFHLPQFSYLVLRVVLGMEIMDRRESI